MDISLLVAAFMAAFVAFGHLAFGVKLYLKPMQHELKHQELRAVVAMIFHYITVFTILAAIPLLMVGLGRWDRELYDPLLFFIGLNYAGFTVVQLYFAFESKVPKPLTTYFQWIFFSLIALFTLFFGA